TAVLTSVGSYSSTEAVHGLLKLVRAESPVLDVTYGNGTFWRDTDFRVVGLDKNPGRARHVRGDFKALPFASNSFPTVVYDPPYHPNGRSPSGEIVRYGSLGTNCASLKTEFLCGLSEAWRVSSRHLLVKCQSYVNG